jgi:ectoine hydroxylase-related dioxygenase (phytanoyl-CoA dioxygenase family)
MSVELDAFGHQGYVVARGLLDEGCIGQLRQSIARTCLDQLQRSVVPREPEDVFPAMCELHRRDLDRYRRVVASLWRKLDVYRLIHDPRIIGFLHDSLGWRDVFVPGGQVVHVMAHELKIPGGYFGQPAHQDFPSVQGSLDGVVVWLPLVDVDRSNFPLELIPGSHCRGLLPTVGCGATPWETRQDQYDGQDFVPIEVDVGDVVFISTFAIHRSSVHGLPGRFRLAVSSRFDNGGEQTFIDRCYPSAYQRTVHRDPYVPGFPTRQQIEDFFSAGK